jgi:hypothetical protein
MAGRKRPGVREEPGRALAYQRLAAQLLSAQRAATPYDVVGHLLAVQGQDARGARLAIRARTRGLTAAAVDRELTEDRSLLITWLNRGTLHLVHSEDYWWLHPLTTPQLQTANARRLAQEGVTPAEADRGGTVIERHLAADGPSTRQELRGALVAAGVRVEGQALVHILLLASLRGLVVRGPMIGADHAYVLVRDWLGHPPPELERDEALARLARRYLVGHGPAEDRDLAKWAGVTLGDARRGIGAIASELVERPDGLAALAAAAPPSQPCPPRLLGAFDPLLLGWVSREPYLGLHQGIVTVNGLFRPVALVGSRAVATWAMPRGEVVLDPFAEIEPADAEALRVEAQDVVRFLGGTEQP